MAEHQNIATVAVLLLSMVRDLIQAPAVVDKLAQLQSPVNPYPCNKRLWTGA